MPALNPARLRLPPVMNAKVVAKVVAPNDGATSLARMKLFLLSALAGVLATAVFAATPVEMLEQLRTSLSAELRSALDKGNGENNQRLFQIESLLVEQLPSRELPEDQFTQMIQILGQLRSLTRDPKSAELCQSLIVELRTLATARDRRFKEAFAATVKEALITGLKATVPKDVDAPLLALANIQKQANRTERSSNGRGVDTQPLTTAISILTLWQDAMLPRAGVQRSRDSLDQLESMTQSYAQQLGDLLPRSEFITLLNSGRARLDPVLTKRRVGAAEISRQSADILRGVKKLEDVSSALKAMEALASDPENGSTNNSPAIQTLRKIHKLHEELKAGMSVTLSSVETGSSSGDTDETVAVRGLIIKFALPRVLNVTGDAMPKDSESVPDYLARMLEESRRKSDWQLLSKVMDTAQSLKPNSLLATGDAAALRSMLAGINQERARQYAGAVAYYLAALRSGSQAVPSEMIGEKLEAIRKDHPQDYEAGNNLQIIEPTPQRYGGPPSYYMNGGPRSVISTQISASAGIAQPAAPLVVPAVPRETAAPKATAPAEEKKAAAPAKPEGAAGEK